MVLLSIVKVQSSHKSGSFDAGGRAEGAAAPGKIGEGEEEGEPEEAAPPGSPSQPYFQIQGRVLGAQRQQVVQQHLLQS